MMVADCEGSDWIFRRDRRIKRPLREIGSRSPQGIPLLVPEIQLLFKAKETRSKDEADFSLAVEHLKKEQRHWLTEALKLAHPGHSWVGRLI